MSETTTEANPFGDQYDAPEGSGEAVREIEYDRWGRYANLPPVPSADHHGPLTRVTTLAKTLEDSYHLDQWRLRQTVIGLKLRPTLLDVIGGRDVAKFHAAMETGAPLPKVLKDLVQGVASTAMEEAGSYDGADKGTAFHDLAERLDAGHPLDMNKIMNEVTDDQLKMLTAYSGALQKHKLRAVPEYMERVICVPELGVAGRLDRIYEDSYYGPPVLRIGDLKSQKTLDFGHMALSIQLACYSHAKWILNHETWQWEPMPELDVSKGVIAWVPAIEPGRAEVHDVDLDFGWQLAKAALKVRGWRKQKGILKRRAL